MLVMRLELAGHECDEAASGHAALDRLNTAEIALLLADTRMPGMTGLELAKQVREQHPGVITVIMSGEHSPEERTAAIAAGAALWLPKPLPSNFEASLTSLLAEHHGG